MEKLEKSLKREEELFLLKCARRKALEDVYDKLDKRYEELLNNFNRESTFDRKNDINVRMIEVVNIMKMILNMKKEIR